MSTKRLGSMCRGSSVLERVRRKSLTTGSTPLKQMQRKTRFDALEETAGRAFLLRFFSKCFWEAVGLMHHDSRIDRHLDHEMMARQVEASLQLRLMSVSRPGSRPPRSHHEASLSSWR